MNTNAGDVLPADLEIIAEWNSVLFRVVDKKIRERWENSAQFGKAIIQGIKVDRDGQIYITSARWGGPDVPSTVNKLVRDGDEWMLEAYPSEEMNDVDNPDGLKSVLGFEIDRNNVMWILDQGHIEGSMQPGDAKLVLWDITANKEVQRYVFPAEEVSPAASFLNDVVVDNDTGFAYIADSGIFSDTLQGGLVIFDSRNNRARRILDKHKFTNDDPNFFFNLSGRPVLKGEPMRTGADGIALSGDKKTMYWTNLTGNTLYSLPTILLRDFGTDETVLQNAVRAVMTLPSNTDGMTCDRDGNLYMTALMINGLMRLDAETGQLTRFVYHPDISWPDTLGWGPEGDLFLVTNNLHLWADGDMDFATPNFRVWKVPGVGRSYMRP